MGQAISTEHPAVVLRSRYQQLRALLAVSLVAVVALAAAVVRRTGGPDESTVANAISGR